MKNYLVGWIFVLLALCLSQPFLGISLESFASQPDSGIAQNPAASKPDHLHDQLLVRFKEQGKAHVTASKHGASVERSYDKLGIYLLKLPPGLQAEEAVKKLASDPDVQYASLDYLVQADVLPNDPRFGDLWGLHNTGQSGGSVDADVDAPAAWDIITGSSGIVVGVVDTGVDYNHEDLQANMWRNPGEVPGNGVDDDGNGYVDDVYGMDAYNHDSDPMDDHNHGTHVSGTIGAVGGNGIGIIGLNWQVRIMALKFLGASGSGSTSGAIECINYAVTMASRGVNIRVLSNSWGGGSYSTALRDAIQTAANSGILFVAAAGNSAANNDASPHYPSSYQVPNVIVVASTDRNDQRSSFSSYGLTTVDVAAPGSSILSTTRNNQYASFSGTSMATPHVSGIAALVLVSDPTMSFQSIKKLILFSSDSVSSLSGLILSGGRANANNALRREGTSLRIFRTMTTFSAYTGETLRLEVMAGLYDDPVPGINVIATFSNGSPSLTLRDDGVSPDTAANDGMFTGSWVAGDVGSVMITFTASASGLNSATTIMSGGVTFPYRVERPSYNWIEISGTGTPLELGDDSVKTVSLPVTVRFGGQSFASLTASANGFISFSGQDAGYSNAPMPVTGLSSFLAVFWDDLIGKPAASQGIVYWQVIGTAPSRQVVVEWKDLAHYSSPNNVGSFTFEAVLYEDSENVLMQYQRTSFGDTRFDGGASATIGIQTGSSSAVQYCYNTLNAAIDSTAILYTNAAVRVTVTMFSTSYGTTTKTVTNYISTYSSTSTIPTVTTVVLVPLTVTSTVQGTHSLTSILTTPLTSYTSTTTSTSTIPTTVALVPLTMTSTVQSTESLTSILTRTATSYTGTQTTTSTIVVPTTVTLAPSTSTSTVETTQGLVSTGTTTVTGYTTTTATSYTGTETSTSTSIVYTTVTILQGPSPFPPASLPGVSIGTLPAGYETSGLAWHSRLQKFLTVSDGGTVSSMNTDGSGPVNWSVPGDLEGICVANAQSDYVYIGVEHPDSILEFNIRTGTVTRTFDLTAWMTGADNQGLEGLTFVPSFDSAEGGIFYAGLQADGRIYLFELPIVSSSTSTNVTFKGIITLEAGLADIADLSYDDESGVLLSVFDGPNRLKATTRTGQLLQEWQLPGTEQEGILFHNGALYVGEDYGGVSTGRVIRYAPFSLPVITPMMSSFSPGDTRVTTNVIYMQLTNFQNQRANLGGASELLFSTAATILAGTVFLFGVGFILGCFGLYVCRFSWLFEGSRLIFLLWSCLLW